MAAGSGAPSAALPTDPVLRVLERDAEVREAGPDRVRGREVPPLSGVLAKLSEEGQEAPAPAPPPPRRGGPPAPAPRPDRAAARSLPHASRIPRYAAFASSSASRVKSI